MAPLPYINDRSRFAAALNNALSASYGSIDGDVIKTAGFNSANDGASLSLRLAASSTDTIDGIFTFPGKGGVLSFDSSNVFNGTAGTGRHKTLDTAKVDLKQVGADPTGGTSASSFLQRAVTSVPEGGEVHLPAGTYLVGDVTLPNTKRMKITGTASKLLAAPGSSCVLNVGADTSRVCPLEISNLCIDGNDVADILGIDLPFRTNTLFNSVTFRRCAVGLIILGYNVQLQTCAFHVNDVGFKVYQEALGGGGNANSFTNVELYNNTIGAIFDGTDASFPHENNNFFGGTIQNNTLCGVAGFSTGNLLFYGTHFEGNGTSGTTETVDGNVVRRASAHFNASGTRFTNCSPGSDNPFIITESGSTVHLDGLHTYGITGNLIEDYDNTTTVLLSGRIVGRGAITAKVAHNKARIEWQARFGYVTTPQLTASQKPVNLAPRTNLPTPGDTSGSTLNSDVLDPIQGATTSVTFAASVGSSGSNRAIFSTGFGTIAIGEHILLTMLVKTSEDTQLQFDVTDGSYTGIAYTFRDREWQKIVLLATASASYGPSLYVYPLDDAGATVQFAKLQTIKVDADEKDIIYDILDGNLYNDNTQSITLGTDADLVINNNTASAIVYEDDVEGFIANILPTIALPNKSVEITRNDDGDGTIYVKGAGVLLAKKQWVRARFDGSNWQPMQKGGDGTIIYSADYIANDANLDNRWNGDANLDTTGDPNDVQGNQNLTWSGTPAYDTAPPNAEDGLAFDFDGSNYLTAPSTTGDYTDNFTCALWIYLESSSSMRIVSKRDGAGSWDFTFSTGKLNMYDGTTTFNGAASQLTQTTWIHIALVINGASSGFYINGVLSGSLFSPTISSSGSDLYVGRYPLSASSFFIGKMADIRLFNRALTSTELYMLSVKGI